MTRRRWIACCLGGPLACCRREAPAPAAVAPPAWTPLEEHWQHQMGGALERPAPGVLRLGWGESLSAAKWTGAPVAPPFVIELEARRIDGTDFFCGLTFPAGPGGACLTWIVGGWGGALVGLSSIDGEDASRNETRSYRSFEAGRWYRLELEHGGARIRARVDGETVIDFHAAGKALSLRPGPIEVCAPFGLATWQSTGEFRGLRWRPAGRA